MILKAGGYGGSCPEGVISYYTITGNRSDRKFASRAWLGVKAAISPISRGMALLGGLRYIGGLVDIHVNPVVTFGGENIGDQRPIQLTFCEENGNDVASIANERAERMRVLDIQRMPPGG